MTTGTLRICGTPIGNLGDVTQRLRDTLAGATVIACEDTRRTRALLSALGIPAPKLERLDANTEERGAIRLVERLLHGDDVALVTDAGMPAVSDPGSRLVLAAAAAGVVVEVIPGPSAVTAAFAASGIEGDGFAFIGFLPRTAGGLNARLDAADAWGLPLIAFEAPGRLPRTLATLAAREPERRIVVCRELTKLHEQVARGTVAELAAQFREPPPGEVTLVLAAGAPRPAGGPSEVQLHDALVQLRDSGLGARRASEIAALLSGLPRRELYERLIDDTP
jgi:16S rRNA (cytidine1402-2'-O)-methyltransferase